MKNKQFTIRYKGVDYYELQIVRKLEELEALKCRLSILEESAQVYREKIQRYESMLEIQNKQLYEARMQDDFLTRANFTISEQREKIKELENRIAELQGGKNSDVE